MKQLSNVEKRLFTVVAASLDGYLRLFKVKEKKNMQVCAQINLQDKVFKVLPLSLNP